MGKEFVCTIDNVAFSSKEQLIAHMIENHTTELLTDSPHKESLIKLKDAFPEADVKVYETEDMLKCELYFLLNGEHSGFSFQIGSIDKELYYDTSFETIEEAIEYYKDLFKLKDEFINELKKIMRDAKVEIFQLFDGDYTSSPSVGYELVFEDGRHYSAHYDYSDPATYIRKLQGLVINSVEGLVTESNDTFLVDGVEVEHMLKRAKRVKIEILEEKKE